MDSYQQTLIAVADDCPVRASVQPTERGGKPTVAVLQYEMLSAHPRQHTMEDVLFQSWLARQESAAPHASTEIAQLRAEFFAKPQACLRASPLPKKYGFGLLFDEEGRIELCPMESAEYRQIVAGKAKGIRVLKAMRSAKAK